MGGWCRWDWLVREGDTHQEARMKKLVFTLCLYLVFFNLSAVYVLVNTTEQNLYLIGLSLTICATILMVVGIARNMPNFIDTSLALWTVGLCINDLAAVTRAFSFRNWTITVLLLDIALLFKRDTITRFILVCVVVYNVGLSIESLQRFGLYEAGYWGSGGAEAISLCNCASPPCKSKLSGALLSFFSLCTVFIADFFLTRGFATGMRLHIRRLEASVEVAAEIAAALARYDVDAAQQTIDHGGDLPEELAKSLTQIVCNLRAYRDYLPEVLLNPKTTTPNAVPPPRVAGGGEVEVGIVFTEIESSAELWGAQPQGMHEAVRTHNTILRGVARDTAGYEVKSTGDSLMVAFHTAANAVVFGVEAQLRLVRSEWPAALSSHPLCERQTTGTGELLWHGVRVGIGINWGPAQPSQNPVTGRYDYLGSTVSTAAGVLAALLLLRWCFFYFFRQKEKKMCVGGR
eukprot:Hpha_TRINITY_DN16046_c4_g1::TRINITY_DN16046_c4_g1_i2::g.117950::m.117950